ncbi:P-selectin [Ditylenchus destructor]|uniref:p-selectin n=1 Tax=Ditylenchus destructor TaxID=166010 RepID=A0AAD4N3S9_9BILA|nr:P-selectin [Ditylenchus destructor]
MISNYENNRRNAVGKIDREIERWQEERQIRCPAPLTTLPVPDVMANDILRIYVPAVFSSATLDNGNGSWAYYDCPPGTIPRGKQSFTECLPNGTWSQIEMACLKLGCYAENVDFGHFEDFWTPAEGRPARIKCIEGSKFDNLLPRCIQKNDNSVVTDMCQERSFCGAHGRCKTLMGNYTCECDHGYRFQANESAGHQCKAINKCAEKLDLCSSAECEPSLASPTDYLCACAENMTEFTKGLNRTLVIPNVEYLHPNRSCIRSRCPIPNLNSSFVIANESMLFLAGSRMKIYCKGRTGVLANVSCLPNGNWDGEIPQYCHKTSCKSISLPNHATFIKHPLTTFAQQPTYYVDDVVSFRCYGQNAPGESNLGYYLMGPESILCLPSGEWSNPPPICVLPQCSAIDDPPPGGANMTRFSPNTPTGEKFAENTTIEFKCEGRNGSVIFVEAIMCIKNRTIDGEFHMTWSVNTFPNCSAYLELNSTRNFRCDMKADGDIRPSKKHFEEGEQANFTCIQPNYELSDPRPLKCTKYNSDFTRDSTRFSRLKRGTEDVSNSQLSPDSTILQDCIVPRHYKSTVFLGASVLLRCQLNSKCQNYQVRWVHQTSGFSLPTSYLHSSHVVSALIESVKISDQGKYVCEVLDQNGNVLDSGAWIVDVLPDRKVRGWTEIISQTRPTTVVAMDSAKRLSGWSASVHFSKRFSHLITPMVEVHTDWLGINVDLADCRDCLVWLSYYSTDSNVDAQKLPLDRFSTLGGATVDPNSHSIQFVLPFSKVWILIAVDSGSASSSFRIKNLRFTVTACAQIQLGLMTFPETTVSPKNKTVSGTCASQHSIMPSISGLKCSPTGVWYIDEENPPICVCESGYVEYLGGCVSRGPLCYSCTNSLQANCTRFANAQYCSEGEVCQSVSRFSANQNAGALGYVEKKCVPEEVCKNSFDASAKQCQPLQVGETIPVRFGLSSALPYCIDRQQMRLTCDPIIKVRRLGRFFYEPTRIKWPTVVDNDPTFAISSNLRPELMTIKVPLYPFDGSEKDILWIAVDKHGASATCITKVIFEDVLSPELLCPDLYVDDVYGSTGTDIPIRLPSDLIQFQDDTSQSTKLQITINPPNGSFIEIDKPVMINVTTIDENSNQAQCQFWYQAVVKDCPLWQIDMEEYTCTNRSQLNDQIVACYRKRPCDGDRRQLPENFKALICIPGQDGWRLLQDGVGNHNAFLRQQNPTCLGEFVGMHC